MGPLQPENIVLCKARAKRGFATHPRSIAERVCSVLFFMSDYFGLTKGSIKVRRTRIAENMKKLQELVPGVDKQANTSDMLEEAVDYMKYLAGKVLVCISRLP